MVQENILEIPVIDFEAPGYLHDAIIINCFEKEDFVVDKEDVFKDEPSKFDAIEKIHTILKPGEPITIEAQKRLAFFILF